MIRKTARFALALGALVCTGVADLSLCCTLVELSRPVSTEIRNCCGNPDCCRSERRGPAPASLAIKVPKTDAPDALSFALFPTIGPAPAASALALTRLGLFERDHPPPPDGRGTYLRISLLRV